MGTHGTRLDRVATVLRAKRPAPERDPREELVRRPDQLAARRADRPDPPAVDAAEVLGQLRARARVIELGKQAGR